MFKLVIRAAWLDLMRLNATINTDNKSVDLIGVSLNAFISLNFFRTPKWRNKREIGMHTLGQTVLLNHSYP